MKKLFIGNIPYTWCQVTLANFIKDETGDFPADTNINQKEGRSLGNGWAIAKSDTQYNRLLQANGTPVEHLNIRIQPFQEDR